MAKMTRDARRRMKREEQMERKKKKSSQVPRMSITNLPKIMDSGRMDSPTKE